jgi:exodeoxyribonuclease-1
VDTLAEQEVRFEDARLPEMLFRYRARNYPDTLIGEEMERWEQFRTERLMQPKKGWRSLEAFGRELQRLASDPEMTPRKQQVLEDLHLYGESLIPYM